MQPEERLHLRGPRRVRLGEERQRLRGGGVEPARRVVEGTAERTRIAAPQQARAELPDAFGLVAIGLVAVAAQKAGADGDVGRARPHELEQPLELGRGMLAVGVDSAAERVPVLERPFVARGDAGLEAAVLAEGEHLGAVVARDGGRRVGGAVVDDEDVDVGQLAGGARRARPAGCPPRSRPG